MNVAINGFGRIGRMVFKAGLLKKVNFVAINDLTDTKTLAHLFKYDSVHGKFEGTVRATKDSLVINGKKIKVYSERDPENLPWKEHKVDVVVESTGFFRTRGLASKHIKAGAKKVLVSAPCKSVEGEKPVKALVYGINDDEYDGDEILSNGSCTTNCLAPMVKVMQENFKIVKAHMTTVHAYTSTQKLVDGPAKDLRRARNAATNIIPTTTGAAKVITKIFPELEGKFDAMAVRVPVPDGSFTNLVCEVKKKVSAEDINLAFKKASKKLKGVLEYTEDPIVSSDIVTNPHSCIFDSLLTNVIDGNLVKISGWYDNEWGYSNRMIDMLKIMKK